MKRGGNLDAADGFTIVEVMIVLAVSALLLISAITLINGRQAKTEFTTGINDEQSQLQQIISDTAGSYYPNNADFTCAGNPGGQVTLHTAPPGSVPQGTNAGCIFLGKAIQFGLGPTAPGNGTLGVLPIIANAYQFSGGNKIPVLTVTSAVPRALYPANGSASEAVVPTDTVERNVIGNGLQIANGNKACGASVSPTTAVCYVPVSGGGPVETGMVAFVDGDSAGNIAATASGSGSNLQSGTPQLSLYAVKGSHKDDAMVTASGFLSNLSGSPTQGLDPAQEVMICIADVGGNIGSSGLFTIGGTSSTSNGGLNVTLQIKDDPTC